MKLFKNIIAYRLGPGWEMSPGTLEGLLANKTLQPCTGLMSETKGWIPVMDDLGLVANADKTMAIHLGFETKVIPASALRREVDLQKKDLEQGQGYAAGKKQLRDLKEKVYISLLAKAFVKTSSIRATIDPVSRWVLVDAASPARAERLLETLRDTLGEFPVTRVETANSQQFCMTEWLRQQRAPGNFELDSECHLVAAGSDEASSVKYSRHALAIREIIEHIEGGKVATSVSLVHKDQTRFSLSSKHFGLNKISWMVQAEDESQETNAAELFEADLRIVTANAKQVLDELILAMGGESETGEAASRPIQTDAAGMPLIAKAAIDEERMVQNLVQSALNGKLETRQEIQARYQLTPLKAETLLSRVTAELSMRAPDVVPADSNAPVQAVEEIAG